MNHFFHDKVVVITGASSGMGRDLAVLLASWGSKVALVARRQSLLDEVSAECEGAGGATLPFVGDVTDEDAMHRVRDEVFAKWGFADIVIANAGVGGLNPADNFSLEVHRKVVEINCIGLANTLMPFVPSMVERKRGHLVGISSLAAFRGLPNAASYSSSKAAQMVFLESMRVDLRKHHVAVTCIHPGFIESPMTDHDEFRMPFKMNTRESSMLIAKAIKGRKASYLYPWPMRIATSINKHLPRFLYDTLVPRLSGQKEKIEPRIF
jgi:short-subunit dehydrogenase